jgi:hypothetical protein
MVNGASYYEAVKAAVLRVAGSAAVAFGLTLSLPHYGLSVPYTATWALLVTVTYVLVGATSLVTRTHMSVGLNAAIAAFTTTDQLAIAGNGD